MLPDTVGEEWAAEHPLQESCRAFSAGQLDPGNKMDVRSLLSGEGQKRLESFTFELLFARALQKYCPEMSVATGWYVLSLNGRTAGLWIRLDTGEGLNRADAVLLKLLDSQGCAVLKVRCPVNRFVGCWRSASNWTSEVELHALMYKRFGQPRNGRQPRRGSDQRTASALDTLFSKQSEPERTALALTRLLINCFIVPYIRRQPLDLDAVILNEAAALRFVEFKRKYPSCNMFFGLDSGHAVFARWLDVAGHRLTNVVLLDPCRIKAASPFHLLDKAGTQRHALWVGTDVSPSLFSATGLHTSGEDSGMFDTERDQSAIHISHYALLGRGFGPRELRPFLNGEPVAEQLTERLVKDAKRNAKVACSGADQTA